VSKNLIYMVSVNHETSTYKNSDYAKFAKLSWKFWCKKITLISLLLKNITQDINSQFGIKIRFSTLSAILMIK